MASSSPYINRFIQPDTLIPGPSNPQSWNRYAYTFNNPIINNDPSGHCPVCGAAIGATIGAIAGAVLYTYNNHQTFNVAEYETAVVASAIAGGLIGSGIGVLADPEATVAALGTAASVISAGTAASVSGGTYITQNPEKFETKPYITNTSISAATAYINSSPSTTAPIRLGISLVGGEANYLLTTKTQDPSQALGDMGKVFVKTLISRGVSEAFSSAITPMMTGLVSPNSTIRETAISGRLWDSPNLLSLAASQRAREGLSKAMIGLFNGYQAGKLSRYIQKLTMQ